MDVKYFENKQSAKGDKMKEKSDQTNNRKSNKIKHVSFVLGAGILLSIVRSNRVILLCDHNGSTQFGVKLGTRVRSHMGQTQIFPRLSHNCTGFQLELLRRIWKMINSPDTRESVTSACWCYEGAGDAG